jgi:hypothetical protein
MLQVYAEEVRFEQTDGRWVANAKWTFRSADAASEEWEYLEVVEVDDTATWAPTFPLLRSLAAMERDGASLCAEAFRGEDRYYNSQAEDHWAFEHLRFLFRRDVAGASPSS